MNRLRTWTRIVALSGVFLMPLTSARADFYVAPHAVGTGRGTTPADAASYLDLAFWNGTVQPALRSGALAVWFADGAYCGDQLTLTRFGHPVNRCTFRATTAGHVTLGTPPSARSIVWLHGCQNIEISGLRFTGASSMGALNLSYAQVVPKSGTRNVVIRNCWFEDLTNLKYGAILFGANQDITIDTCHFRRISGPAPKQVHAIYVGHRSEGAAILHSDFTDIGGEYVRFRDADYGIVDHCSFHSTAEAWNSPFITVPLYNSIPPSAREFYGTHFQFSNNVFRYDAPNPSPRADSYCFAHYIYNSGYNVAPGRGLDYMLDPAEAATLGTGTVQAKEKLLEARMGLTNTKFKIIHPEYHGVVWAVAYRGYGAANRGYAQPVNISDWPGATGAVDALPLVRNGGFESRGDPFRDWHVYGGGEPREHPGLHGTAHAIRLARASPAEVGQWLSSPDPGRVTLHCLFAVGESPGRGVKFQVRIYHDEIADACLAFAVDEAGRCGVMNGGTFAAVPELGTIQFSRDANGNGGYGDAVDTLVWYSLRISVNYATPTPEYSIARGLANTVEADACVKSHLTAWVNGPPLRNARAGVLAFVNAGADVVVDEVR